MARPHALVGLIAIAFVHAGACTDPGVIGEVDACEPACAADEICDAELRVCLACIDDTDCEERGDGLYCEANICVECRSSSECGDAGAVCAEGSCRACETDAECSGEQTCASGRCAEPDEPDEEEDEEDEGASENSDPGSDGEG